MKNKLVLALCLVLSLSFLSSCGKGDASVTTEGTQEQNQEENQEENQGENQMKNTGVYPQLEEIKSGDTIAILNTNMGQIKLRFFPEYAPKAVENFLVHAQNGYYDGVTFHRVINEFMIQGGDPWGDGTGGESIWGEEFENEVSVNMRHFRGALSMANAGADTNGSQFFIVQATDVGNYKQELEKLKGTNNESFPDEVIDEYITNGGTPFLDGDYSVFGQVYEGMDVVDKIAQVETDGYDKPLEDVIIKSIEVGTY